jgi:hypothetical protein
MVRYFGQIPRTFNVTSSIYGTIPVPGDIEYGFQYSEGGVDFYTPVLGTGTVTTGGQFHAPVTLNFTWNPTQQNDYIHPVWRMCGEPIPQPWTRGAINTTAVQIP